MDAEAILEALGGLCDSLANAEAIGDALYAAGGDNGPPPWVFVYCEQVRQVTAAAERLEALVRPLVPVPALPSLWGVGGVAPDGDSASTLAQQSTARRDASAAERSSRPGDGLLTAGDEEISL